MKLQNIGRDTFDVDAAGRQFYLEDEWRHNLVAWTEEELDDRVALAPGTIGVSTNCESIISIEIRLADSNPPTDLDAWDHLVECGIEISSSSLVISGWFNDWEEASRITYNPATTLFVCASEISSYVATTDVRNPMPL